MPADQVAEPGLGPVAPRARALGIVQRHPNILAVAVIAGAAVLPLLLVPVLWNKGPVSGLARTERGPRPGLAEAPRPHRAPLVAAAGTEGGSPERMTARERDSALPAMTFGGLVFSVEPDPLAEAGREAPRAAGLDDAATGEPSRRAEAAPVRPPRHLAAHAGAARRHTARTRRNSQVLIRRRAGSDLAAEAARLVAAAARRAGFKVAGMRADPLVPVARFVRYYHRRDAAAAERLARRLGSEWQTQDFRAFPRPGRAGVLEVWLPYR